MRTCHADYTLPDKPEDYIHRVGRVGRADRMGLAVSLVGAYKEKVWYHQCPSRGRGCQNTALTDQGGCCIWYDEPKYLREIEVRLQAKIPPLPADLRYRPAKEGVVYGRLRSEQGQVVGHAAEMQQVVQQLATLERNVQEQWLDLVVRFAPPQQPSSPAKRQAASAAASASRA